MARHSHGIPTQNHIASHAHLTNSIHMHRRHSPIQHQALMRDLMALQRSRSLQDPSTSPNRRSVGEPDAASRKSRKSLHAEVKTLLDQLEEVPRRKYKGAKRVGVRRANKGRIGNVAEMYHHHKCKVGEEEGELDVNSDMRKMCGLPWNWSRIHDRSKSFLDMAGKSLSCGLSDARVRDADGISQHFHGNGSGSNLDLKNIPLNTETESETESESFPLLNESSSSHLFDSKSDNSNYTKSRSKSRSNRSLTEKYAPKTFKDLIGQNLVVQALTNAIQKRKIGSVYLFYGPHGTGKTSCARVFAKALNCQSIEQPKPCDICPSCISHNVNKNRNLIELTPLKNSNKFEKLMSNLNYGNPNKHQTLTLIIDEINNSSPEIQGFISRTIEKAPRNVIFILISLSLDDLPQIILSKCQKFFFNKLKESDIVNFLQWVSSSEGFEVEREALKLIASRSDGSLRDAEMTLEQLSLLNQRISVSLVQQLVGLVSDEKLVDLLDFALAADTINTVKKIRELTETGIEPLALISQLATLITDILAGSFNLSFTKRRKFFKRPTLSKEEMEKLRKALKTLSESEKQLRATTQKATWLTAALLQLAPDQNYLIPTSSSSDSPLNADNPVRRGNDENAPSTSNYGARRMGNDENDPSTSHCGARSRLDNSRIWQDVLDCVQSDSLRRFLVQEAKLNSVTLGEAPTVQLTFRSSSDKSKAEKFRGQILNAFESVLSCAVILEIRHESKKSPPNIPTTSYETHGMSLRRSLNAHQRFINSNEGFVRVVGPHILTEGEVIETRVGKGLGFRERGESIVEKLERDNLRLEPRSRSLLCWRAARPSQKKVSMQLKKLRIRVRKSRSLLKCGMFSRCLKAGTPR
ncbi:hypothetical protein LUZ60_008444 [Juncus effusus]|nr:hypothetical protein LUZ60_008444 [Juncus effusus]